MTLAADPHPSACIACDVTPLAVAKASKAVGGSRLVLSVPNAYCAVCISTIEGALHAHPGVRSARVNLTMRRVSVDAGDAVRAEDLVEVLAKAGHKAQEMDEGLLSATATDRKGRDLLMRAAVAGFAMMNVMLLSVAVWSGASDATRDLFHWVSAGIALPVIAFSGRPFYAGAWSALRVGRLNMDVPISLAIVLAGAMSLYETTQHGERAYFDAALSLTFFLLAGRWLDHRTRAVARSAAEQLSALEVRRVTMADGRMLPLAQLVAGDLVRVLPGTRVPVDGEVLEGTSELDRSLLTGESVPAVVRPGASVTAGEVNLTGALLVKATTAGTDTALHRMADLVAVAESARNRYTSLADRAARVYAPVVHVLAALAFTGWYVGSGDLRLSINIAIAVLIITCPCALGLAVPAVVTAASGKLFRRGLLIKNATALERLAEVDHVAFDKTGTLTEGRPVAHRLPDLPDALPVALALAQGSAHPLSQALAEACRAAGVVAAPVEDLREVPGCGVRASWRGAEVRLGRADWTGAAERDGLATWLRLPDLLVPFGFSDRVRPSATGTVAALKRDGLSVEMLSGDSRTPAETLGTALGLPVHAGLMPEDKAEILADRARDGHKVLMVGDGLNDTVALAAAHASISPASALDAARAVSDIVLLGQSLDPIPGAIRTARLATRRIKENFAIAACYNLVSIPIALAGFASPLAASLAMSTSSILVALNAVRLR